MTGLRTAHVMLGMSGDSENHAWPVQGALIGHEVKVLACAVWTDTRHLSWHARVKRRAYLATGGSSALLVQTWQIKSSCAKSVLRTAFLLQRLLRARVWKDGRATAALLK